MIFEITCNELRVTICTNTFSMYSFVVSHLINSNNFIHLKLNAEVSTRVFFPSDTRKVEFTDQLDSLLRLKNPFFTYLIRITY